MKKNITKSIFMIASIWGTTLFAQGPTFHWANGIGGGGYDDSRSVTVDNAGNVYATGSFDSIVDFNPGTTTFNLTSAGAGDIFVTKFNSSGTFVWAKRFGGTADDGGRSVKTDANGNVYVTGQFQGTTDFDPNEGTFNLTAAGNADIFVVKLDVHGNLVWAKQLGGTSTDIGYSIAVDAGGNVFTSGYFTNTADFDPGAGTVSLNAPGSWDIFISKLDAAGNYVWAKQIGGSSNDASYALTLDPAGNIYTTGTFFGTADFDPGAGVFNLVANGTTWGDIFVSKLDNAGNFVWASQMGGIDYDEGHSIGIDAQGNVYTAGIFSLTADFDPSAATSNMVSAGGKDIFVSKLDASGNFVWAKQMGGNNQDWCSSMAVDAAGNVYTTGYFTSIADFNPGGGTNNLTSAGDWDAYISKLDNSGSFLWVKQIGSIIQETGQSIAIDNNGNLYTSGNFSGTVDFNPGSGAYNLAYVASQDVFLLKLKQNGVIGYIYNDISHDCHMDDNENGLYGFRIMIQPGNHCAQTNDAGAWEIDSLPPGNYTATCDNTGQWQNSCGNDDHPFTVTDTDSVCNGPNIGCENPHPCSDPDISIMALTLRKCVGDQTVYVTACNDNNATGSLDNAYAEISLDSLISIQSASLPYSILGNNNFRFDLGDINPGQCVNFTLQVLVSCDAVIEQTLCIEANLFPADPCVLDTIPDEGNPDSPPGEISPCTLPWDHSSLSVDGYCHNDSVYFTITNGGDFGGGDMVCYAPVRIYVDGVYTELDSIMLSGGQTVTYAFAGNGSTWVLQADQHPLHPGNSHPNAHVEVCGDSTSLIPGIVTEFPQDDADPVVDIYCGPVTASYDPNDKTGYPTGLTTDHYIHANQQLQYVVRFQNTGNDTAFTVVVRDTLDNDLNLFTVTPGVASHPYTFRVYGQRVLEWTFNNILLPDSNTNEMGSHGFLTYHVEQNRNLAHGTQIFNDADIYFDFNEPVITNQTLHTITDMPQILVDASERKEQRGNKFRIYPNPTASATTIEFTSPSTQKGTITVRDIMGGTILNQNFNALKGNNRLPLTVGKSGIFFVSVGVGEWKGVGKVVAE